MSERQLYTWRSLGVLRWAAVCEGCGALIWNTQRHDRWHESLAQLLDHLATPAADGAREVAGT